MQIGGGNNLIYPDLSYQIMSLVFEVHNKIGNKWREIDFCNGIEAVLKRDKINYEREKKFKLEFEGCKLAEGRIDFVIENSIILEFKKIWRITDDEIKQVLRYLDAVNLKLAIIINIKHRRVEFKRVINPRIR